MSKYTIGVDFGTESGRAAVVDVSDGRELADSTFFYPHGVMDEALPDGTKLGFDWALQYPEDYLQVFYHTIPEVMKVSGVSPDDVIGIGVDFTACTVLPVKKDGTPLCMMKEYEHEPNAYVKLWKHHAAQDKANLINEKASEMGETWIERYGGKVSSEWELPKAWQILDEAPHIYDAADYIVEAADWVVWQLCGVLGKNTCCAGYKGLWHYKDGYPSKEFLKALDPRLENFVEDKLDYPIVQLCDRVGGLTADMAGKLGLNEGTTVTTAIIDAHVAVPASKITKPNVLLAIMGTSTCHILVSEEEHKVPGICGVVAGGVYPGLYAYEAGQACVGDHFSWFVKNCVPAEYVKDAESKGMNIHKYLREKVQGQKPGESGLLALDWWNGNRSILVDGDLTGMMLGMTLQTKPEEMYRALIEATAYGTRKIVETYQNNGVKVDEMIASGGISQKDPMTMQIYADILNKPIKIAGTTQCGALGSAIYAAVAAGSENGGYDDIFTASGKMGKLKDTVYTPNEENARIYDKLYEEYNTLHDYFGTGANDVMKRLKNIKKSVKG
ncbi:MAG: ribulokinase [Clostridia bacterium]|nr:ribulokinase [Clostridia bacterium]